MDENVEAINYERCARADIVGVTGMSVQRFRMKEILAELKRRGCFTVVGGPLVTVQEDYFEGLADVIFIGEAEETWPRFLGEWKQGLHQYRYEQAEKSDMTKVPTPRFDLLKMRHYAFGSLQFSRGCPFQCEFCDIIVTFGRRPRLKTTDAGHRRARRPLGAEDADRLHRRRQPDRQQEGDQGGPPRGRPPGRSSTATRSPSSPRRRSTWPTTPS